MMALLWFYFANLVAEGFEAHGGPGAVSARSILFAEGGDT